MVIKDKFETTDWSITEGGREAYARGGSKAYQKWLNEKLEKEIKMIRLEKEIYPKLKKMNLKELNDRTETLLEQAKKKGFTNDINFELDIIQHQERCKRLEKRFGIPAIYW